MKEKFKTYYDSYLKLFTHLSLEELEILRSQLEIKELGKKDFFFKRGEVQKHMGYVCEGLLRRYYINEKGNKITTGFVKENQEKFILEEGGRALGKSGKSLIQPSAHGE